jgi:hypothetical protein
MIVTQKVKRTDVLMVQIMDSLKHLFDASHLIGIANKFCMQQFDDDDHAADGIDRLPNLPGATVPQALVDSVAPEMSSWLDETNRLYRFMPLKWTHGFGDEDLGLRQTVVSSRSLNNV